jgi:hypothetical protein
MKEKDIDLNAIADKAFEELKPETVDLVVDHELRGVTPEMLDWWWEKMVDSRYYQLWHPKDHVSIEWEVPPSKEGGSNTIHIAEERIGEFPPRKIRIRRVDPASSPIVATYSHVRTACIISPRNRPVIWITHEYQAESYGTRMRSTFRLSADTPQRFIDALREHNIGEMGQFPRFLPELYKKNVA